MNTFEKARNFIYRNARPLDLARWQFHFENGSIEGVLQSLAAYQNADGGFGHALEADCWNPHSSPIQTWAATEVLHETGFTDAAHPIITGILHYLESGADFDTPHNQWMNTVPDNNNFPHAIWWEYNGNGEFRYNPTAALAGFAVRFADRHSALYETGCTIARQAADWFMDQEPFEEMHVTNCFVRLYEYLCEAKVKLTDMALFKEKLIQQVNYNICRAPEKWGTEYVTKPSELIRSRDDMFYGDNAELAELECDFIIQSQLPDGAYPVTWEWYTDDKEFEVAANWWKGNLVIRNMRYLKGFGKLQ